jgi:hypothetical protein
MESVISNESLILQVIEWHETVVDIECTEMESGSIFYQLIRP